MQDTTNFSNDKLAYGVASAAAALDLSPWKIRKDIREGRLKVSRWGSRILIEKDELLRVLHDGR